MKRLWLAVTAALAVVVAGCPIYPDNQSYQVCTARACFDCPDNAYSSACVPWPCQGSIDCPSDFVCNFSGQCVSTLGSNPTGDDATLGSETLDGAPADGGVCIDGSCQ
jgi:hypothetical protein